VWTEWGGKKRQRNDKESKTEELVKTKHKLEVEQKKISGGMDKRTLKSKKSKKGEELKSGRRARGKERRNKQAAHKYEDRKTGGRTERRGATAD